MISYRNEQNSIKKFTCSFFSIKIKHINTLINQDILKKNKFINLLYFISIQYLYPSIAMITT